MRQSLSMEMQFFCQPGTEIEFEHGGTGSSIEYEAEEALMQAKAGREHILNCMMETISEPRRSL